MKITSASGIISLLDESQPELKEYALHKLNDIVDEWYIMDKIKCVKPSTHKKKFLIFIKNI